MRTLYVEAKSKKDINRRLQDGETIIATIYSPRGEQYSSSRDWLIGDLVKVFSKRIGGQPYAKAYGTVKVQKGETRVV